MTSQSTAESITPPRGAARAGGNPAPGPPALQTRLLRGTRPLKRWRYVAVLADDLMACAALVRIGAARQSFWALYDRSTHELRERTRLLPRSREVSLDPGRLRIADRGLALDLVLEERPGVQVVCGAAGTEVWTRKQGGIAAHGTLSLDGRPVRPVRALAVIDDTCGHHPRATEWRWSAGVGTARDGRALAWNLVNGVNDPPSGSERAVWVDGDAAEPPPVTFASDLSQIACADGSLLRFAPEAERARRDNLLLVRSEYRAPFGSFSGTLPGGIELDRGSGVMEHHRARW